MADVSSFLEMMPPLEKGDPRISPVLWDAGMTKTCVSVLENPTDNVVAIIAKYSDSDDGKDYRARYLLRSVVTVAQNPDQKAKLEPVVLAIASQLNGAAGKQVKAALIRELWFCGTPSASKAIAACLVDEVLCADSCRALTSIKDGSTALLVAALPTAPASCRAEIMHSIAVLGEPAGLPALQAGLSDKDLDTRLAAAFGVAKQGDATSADPLVKSSTAAEGWERVQLTNACLILAEKLKAGGKKAESVKIYTALKTTRTDPTEKYIVEISTAALAG